MLPIVVGEALRAKYQSCLVLSWVVPPLVTHFRVESEPSESVVEVLVPLIPGESVSIMSSTDPVPS